MIKVLYLHSSLHLGGAQSVRYMFLKNLDPKIFDIRVCCLADKGEFGEKIEKLGYKVDTLNKRDGLFEFSTTFKLYRYLKNHNFDIVHSSLFYANYHSALAVSLAKVPYFVIEEHGEHNLHLRKRHIPYRLIAKMAAKRSNLIICCSDFVRRGVQTMYNVGDEKIAVLKNLVEDKKSEVSRLRDVVRNELNIPIDATVIGTVSSLYWVKNQKILLELIARPENANLFLVITGDGPLKNKLSAYAATLGVGQRVRILGWRQDIADILNALDIFILPSLSEGLPICLLEAMSMGLPCIASKVGGVEEVLIDRSVGILVRADNIIDLSSALRQLIDDRDLRVRLGLAARQYVMNYFSPDRYVNGLTDLYKRFLK